MTAGMRIRRRGDYPYRPTTVLVTGYDSDPINGTNIGTEPVLLTAPQQIGHVEQMIDVVTPNFRKISAGGGFVSNPMTRSSYDIKTSENGVLTMRAPFYTDGRGERFRRFEGDLYGHFSGGVLLPPDDAALIKHLTSLASTAAYAGIEQPAVQGQVFAAEFLKTLRMIARPASGLRDYILNTKKWRRTRNIQPGARNYVRDVQRNTRDSVTEGANAAANSWNEARFGWRPFLMDLDKILDTLAKGNFSPRKSSRSSQKGNTNATSVKEVTSSLVGGYSFANATLTTSITSEYEVRCGYVYDFRNTIASDFGFRWSDLPATAYELVPFSFVVDWFINLGDYIQALVPKPASRILTAYTTVHTKHTVVDTLGNFRYGSVGPFWSVQSALPGTRTAIFETWQRSPSVAPPSITFETDLTVALRSGRHWDALALLTQLVVNKTTKSRKVK